MAEKLHTPIPGVGAHDTVLVLDVSYGEPEDWAGYIALGRVDEIADVPLLATESLQVTPAADCDVTLGDLADIPALSHNCALDCNSHLTYLLVRGDEIVSTLYPADHNSWPARLDKFATGESKGFVVPGSRGLRPEADKYWDSFDMNPPPQGCDVFASEEDFVAALRGAGIVSRPIRTRSQGLDPRDGGMSR